MTSQLQARLGSARKWASASLLVVVALAQFNAVLQEGQSRWRGGGFGMYADFHPNTRSVWLRRDGGQLDRIAIDGPCEEALERLRRRPDASQVAIAKRCLTLVGSLEVWALTFDPETGELSRRRLVGGGR